MENSNQPSQVEIKNVYDLASFVNPEILQKVTFVKMLPDGTYEDGTTLEEMIRVCVERLQQLNGLFPCRENSIVITKLQEAKMWLDARTADRKARGVEGQHKA